jgi:small-conductance mechanosensitive channel
VAPAPLQRLRARLPDWAVDWLDVLVPLFQILLILLLAYVLYRFAKRLIRRLATHYHWPIELTVPLTSIVRWLTVTITFFAVLERLGVSATVLWTAFSSFAAVGAVAFFAAWSVLSNFFCALLIFTVQPFRLGDYIEVLDTAEKPGAKGRVIDINMLYTTLEEFDAPGAGNRIQIPNTLVFQRVVRRWHGVPRSLQAGTEIKPNQAVAPYPPAQTATN